ncbi:MAG: glycosyltransferase family 2 protein [SAR324 cluster bacterium]|uniref:dolichyl-phosphate beta-glucosyltransferase n=1 Tax=SAR324 cluster bacterium TaxID=2024889 RepID=A0A7X9IKT4_9DELT|nr:glycosyltransferase family 2 protein [SAR324 cluster bacterium]
MNNIPEISVVIPAYNEYRRLPPTLLDIINYFEQANRDYEIIVVDDGSSDQTAELVEKFNLVRPQIRLIRILRNKGKGNAVKEGVLAAVAPKILFADADGSTPIQEFERLEAVLDSGADIVIGSRALPSKETTVRTRWYRKCFGRLFNSFVNWLILPGLSDTQCGFKLFRSAAAKFVFTRQRSRGFSFDVELLYIARKAELHIVEVPVNWTNVPDSKVNLLIDSAKMFRDLFRFVVWHRNINKESFINFKRKYNFS